MSSRPTKRDTILDAALSAFAASGYAGVSMDDLARAAGVAKPTLYNHFGDKESLFGAVVERYATRANAEVMSVVESLDVDAPDLRVELERVSTSLVGCIRKEDGRAVMRLQTAEIGRFPELLGDIRDGGMRRIVDALAGRLAQLVVSGRLRQVDPRRAARQLFALVVDGPTNASVFGEREIPDELVERSVFEAVDTFLAAFGADAQAAADR